MAPGERGAPPPPQLSPGGEFACGLAAGVANVVAGHPFDTVKVRLQTAVVGAHRSAASCAAALVKAEGVSGLYRGLPAPLAGGALETGVNYLVFTQALRWLDARGVGAGHGTPLAERPLPQVLACGALAGAALSVVLSPTELVKCRVQAGRDASAVESVQRIWRHHGLGGFGRGFGATLAREVPGNAIFFATYSTLIAAFAPPVGAPEPSVARQLCGAVLCGGLAGMAFWGTLQPVDVAKTQLQCATPGSPADVPLHRQLLRTFREGGLKRCYAGVGPTLVRAFPANAAQWTAWELSARLLARVPDNA